MANRYAIIDLDSGYVWGVTNADTPEHACQRIDYTLGHEARSYDCHRPGSRAERWGKTGYRVHRVSGDFDVGDGRDRDMIEATESFPCVAIVLVADREG